MASVSDIMSRPDDFAEHVTVAQVRYANSRGRVCPQNLRLLKVTTLLDDHLTYTGEVMSTNARYDVVAKFFNRPKNDGRENTASAFLEDEFTWWIEHRGERRERREPRQRPANSSQQLPTLTLGDSPKYSVRTGSPHQQRQSNSSGSRSASRHGNEPRTPHRQGGYYDANIPDPVHTRSRPPFDQLLLTAPTTWGRVDASAYSAYSRGQLPAHAYPNRTDGLGVPPRREGDGAPGNVDLNRPLPRDNPFPRTHMARPSVDDSAYGEDERGLVPAYEHHYRTGGPETILPRGEGREELRNIDFGAGSGGIMPSFFERTDGRFGNRRVERR